MSATAAAVTDSTTTDHRVHRSTVHDLSGHPVAATCTITYCQYFEQERRIQQLERDRNEADQVRERFASLLDAAAIALNGPEPPLTKWSYHNVPEKIVALQAKLAGLIDATEFYQARAGQHMSEMQNQELIQALEEAKHRSADADAR